MVDLNAEFQKIKSNLSVAKQPTFMTHKQIQEIGCYKRNLPGIIGFAVKEDYFATENKVPMYSVLIDTDAIEENCKKLNLDADNVIKSTLCHELIHVLSVGFTTENEADPDSSMNKDEAYTEKYAEELFNDTYENEVYYSSYSGLGRDSYNKQAELVDADQNRKLYFNGSL